MFFDLTCLALRRSLEFLGIFAPWPGPPGGLQGIRWMLRKRREVVCVLRGVNATAVRISTAVYRLWEIGYLTPVRKQAARPSSAFMYVSLYTVHTSSIGKMYSRFHGRRHPSHPPLHR
ncbi:hypothetical protein FPV67DRAFT_1046697 [Lyophyllum atratum]|nr:hypothetical protein FPV67DRAFT_1046697 [Lyophyllum atratum]